MTIDLKILSSKRDALLLAEMAAWLHMLGKFHEDFLNGNKDLDKQIPQDLAQNYPLLNSLLTQSWTGQIWQQLGIAELNANQLSIHNLIKEHRARNPNLLNGLEKMMWDAHGRGSGLEKGLLNRFAPDQDKIVYLSTAFGFEDVPIDSQDINIKRKTLYNNLQTQLNELKQTNGQPLDGWRCFRQSFISMLSQLFLLSVADTRRPLNDVSLFDQTVASVAFFKASLAQIIILQKWKEPISQKITDKYNWRILRVGFNGIAFWTKSLKINDIDARKRLIPPLLNEIQNLIETEYPMGYEIYRDEMGSVFIVSDVDDLLNATLENGKTLSENISELSRNHLDIEANIHLFPISSPTRNMQSFGQLINETLPEPFPDNKWLNDIEKIWSQRNEVCIVCGLRPQGPNKKSISRNVCDICEKRRLDRAKEWSNKLDHTIWIDETADINGRIALIVGVFDLKDWLNGTLVNSIVAFNPSNRLLNDPDRKTDYNYDYFQLLNDIQQRLMKPKQTLCGGTLVDNLILKNRRGGVTQFGDIYDLYVSDSDLNYLQKEEWRFALALIRQQPSPARIRRIWETTLKFWKEVQADFYNTVGQGGVRLEIRGNLLPNKTGETLSPYHVYEILLGNIEVSVIWDAANNRFISVENMEYLAQPTQLGKSVKEWLEKHKGQKIGIEESIGYGDKNKEWGAITVDKVLDISNSIYTPAIPILTEPRTFLALVPANKAFNVVNAIKKKYEMEMSKVCNRLPLSIGLVFAKSHTPLSSIMDAGRRMLKMPEDNNTTWKIESKNPDSVDSNIIEITLNKNEWRIKVKVKIAMGDNTTLDLWYPYWLIESDMNGKTPSGRKRQFIGPDKKDWVHVCDLQQGDSVKFTSSRLDFEFLDSAARRFEISYKDGKRRDNRKCNRPYYLEELADFEKLWNILKNRLARTQIKGMLGLIEMKREEWKAESDNETFKDFVHNVIHNANWKNGKPIEIDEIENSAVRGKLSDIVELYMDILKDKEEIESEESK